MIRMPPKRQKKSPQNQEEVSRSEIAQIPLTAFRREILSRKGFEPPPPPPRSVRVNFSDPDATFKSRRGLPGEVHVKTFLDRIFFYLTDEVEPALVMEVLDLHERMGFLCAYDIREVADAIQEYLRDGRGKPRSVMVYDYIQIEPRRIAIEQFGDMLEYS